VSATPTYPDLAGKTALVTGASKSIGRSTCRMLAENGVKVAVGADTARQSADENPARIFAPVPSLR